MLSVIFKLSRWFSFNKYLLGFLKQGLLLDWFLVNFFLDIFIIFRGLLYFLLLFFLRKISILLWLSRDKRDLAWKFRGVWIWLFNDWRR
jgi:hypothetical protein